MPDIPLIMIALPESLIERWPILPVAFGKPAEITAALSPPCLLLEF